MYASRVRSGILAVFLGGAVSASPFIAPRAVTESALDPWVSVDASGTPIATITPVLTSVNGVASTINAAPPSLTATTTSALGNSKTTPTSGTDVPTSTGGGSYLVCHNIDGDFAPFCKPDNGSEVYVGQTYYVTWDTTFLSDKNSSVIIQGDYVNSTQGGEQAFHSDFTPNNVGSYAWTIEQEWLQGQSSNNITLFYFPINPAFDEPIRVTGPTLMVTTKKQDVFHQEPAKAPKGQSLYIALPTVFGFILLCVVGGFFWNRKHRKIGLGNVMGRNRGYGTRKSKAQRIGLGKNNVAAIQLQDHELGSGGVSEDATAGAKGHVRQASEALGSLAGTPTEERRNYFREEMKRQEQNR